MFWDLSEARCSWRILVLQAWGKCATVCHRTPSRTPRRLVEDADLQAAKDLFGADLDLDKMQPKSAKDFEDLARALAAKYLHPHSRRCGFAFVGERGGASGACLAGCVWMVGKC